MRTIFGFILLASSLCAQSPQPIARLYAYAPLLSSVSATATQTGSPVRLGNFGTYGTLTITGSGITGSPSGCQIVLTVEQSTGAPASSAIATQSFTPASSNQGFTISPSASYLAADMMIAAYTCSVYPTAGTITVSYNPVDVDAIAFPLPAGTNQIGHVIADSGSTTAVTGTVAVSAASLPLPTGASTAAKQPALGTAGTPSTDVISVQGATSMTPIKVDGSGVTQPVSGTVTANAGTGTFNVSGTFWQTTQPVSGTFWQTTQPVSIATMPTTPVTGTFWQATQPVSGTVTANAGTNLNTSALALDTSVNGILAAQASTTSGQSGPIVQGAVTTSAPTYTTAKTNPLSLDTSGLLRISLKDTPANTNKFLVTPDSVALPLHQSVNVDQINGVTPAMGNGTTSTGTQRVTISSDSTGQVTANAGTNLNTSALALETGGNLATLAGAVSSSVVQSNTKQINGVAPTMGNGVTGTGVQRVTLSSDSTGQVALAAGSATIGALTANQSVNVAQVAGSTASTAATGVQKVGIVGNAGAAVDQAPGSAVPANAVQVGGTDGTNTRVAYMDPCEFNAWTYYPINVSANAQIVAGSSGKNVYVCKMFVAPLAAAANVNIVESATSSNACATSPTGMMGGATAALGSNVAINGGYVLPADKRAWAKTATAGDAMCIFVSAQTNGVLAYVQF